MYKYIGPVKLESGYKSKFEEQVAKQLEGAKVPFSYESDKVSYLVPERKATYTADFFLPKGIIIEVKGGEFLAKDRQKMILVKEQHPELDIRFVFRNAGRKLYKGSKTTYASWCNSHGFTYAEKGIPEEWIKEAKHTPR